jgi:hypothetical protein
MNKKISDLKNNYGTSLRMNASRAFNIGNKYTASEWGWVVFKAQHNNEGIRALVNGVPISCGQNSGVSGTAITGQFILAPGDIYAIGTDTVLNKFIPMY